MTAKTVGVTSSTPELSQKTPTAAKNVAKPLTKEQVKGREGRGKAKSEPKRVMLSGVPATITSAMAARKHHQTAVDTLDKGLEILDSIMDQLRLDAEKGELTNDLSHIASDTIINDADILGAMVSVVDNRKKPSLEFVLGVLGATEVPTPLLERQRTQGQRAVMGAVRNRAEQKRREAKREAAIARAAKAAAEKAAREKAAAEKARVEREAKEAAERKEVERKAAEARIAEEAKKAEDAKKAENLETSKEDKENPRVNEVHMPGRTKSNDTEKHTEGADAKMGALRKAEAHKTVEIARKAASAESDSIMEEAAIVSNREQILVETGSKDAIDDISNSNAPNEENNTLHLKSTKLRKKRVSVDAEPKKSRFSSKPISVESENSIVEKPSVSSDDIQLLKRTGNANAATDEQNNRKKLNGAAAKSGEISQPVVSEDVFDDLNESLDGIPIEKDAEESQKDINPHTGTNEKKSNANPEEKESSNATHQQDSDSGGDAEVFQITVKKSKVASSRAAQKDKRILGRKRSARSTPSPSPSPLPRLTKPPKKTVGDDEMEEDSSDDSDFVDASLGPSLLSSGKHDPSGKNNPKASRPKESMIIKEARGSRKSRFHQYRTEKGRFTSKQNASGSKPRKSALKVVETSDEESESEDDVTHARLTPKQVTTAKHKVSARGRKQKGTEAANSSKADSPAQGEDKPKRRVSDKEFDLSAYQRTPREQRMSGRRTQIEEPGEATPKSGRLRRESSNLNHDNTELQLWDRNPYMGMCYRAWEKINNFAIAIPFREPVRSDDAPGYFDVIKRPMDLRTVRTRVMSGTLTTPVEFQRDMNQIVRNALTYNSKDSDIYDVTLLFREKMRKEVDPIVEAWKAMSSGKGEDISEKVAEVQRMASAGPRSSARYPSRRSSWKPPAERSPSPSPPVKKGRGRGRKRVGFERADTADSEEERAPPPTSKRGSGSGNVSGRGRGRGRKAKGTDRASAKEKEKTKSRDKDKHSEKEKDKDKDRNQMSASSSRTSKRGSKNVASVDEEPSSKRRRFGTRKYRDD